MRHVILASAAALALLTPSVASAANLLANGGFEQTSGSFEGWGGWTFYSGGPNPLPGWTVSFGSVDVTNNQSGWSPASEGFNSLDINGWSRGEIAQTFATVIGQLYSVTFDYSRNAAAAPSPATATVSAGAGAFNVSAPYDTGLFGTVGAMRWQSGGFSFVGTGLDTIRLTATVEGNGGVFFDNISVGALTPSGAVPEPAAWAMMIVGVGLTGATLRRRRTPARVTA